MKRIPFFVLCVLLNACSVDIMPEPVVAPTQTLQSPITNYQLSITNNQLPTTTPTLATTRNLQPFDTAQDKSPVSPSHTPITNYKLPSPTLDPEEWKDLPVIPTVDPSIRAIYEYGQTLGNDPHAFSIFGDCQTRPDEFFGVFETDDDFAASLSPELRGTVANFRGSFNRESSTSQDGTTPGALLWTQWHQAEFTCAFTETPVECELRIHRPSFVIIQIGSHFESRNTEYLRRIIEQLIDEGVVPILATKADNRELDDRVNRDMAMLASEYDLPLWNFWAAVSDLSNRGLYTRDDRPLQGDIYLTAEAALRHRITGLEALNVVWRVAIGQ